MFRFGKVRRPKKNNWRTRWAGTSWQGFTFLQTTNPTNSKYQQFEVISTSPRLQMQYWNIMKGPWDRWDLAYLSFHTILFFFLTFFTVTIFQCCVRTDENKPFAIDRQKPDGAGFYSEDLSYKEFKVKHLAVFFFSNQCNGEKKWRKKIEKSKRCQVWMQLHPDQRQALESPVTIVKRIEQAAQYPVSSGLLILPCTKFHLTYLTKFVFWK